MFVDVSSPERDAFLSQTYGCLIPGYTGHCPTLKFRIGRCYGANTREIIQDLSRKGIVNPAYVKKPEQSYKTVTFAGISYPERPKTAPVHHPIQQPVKARYIRGYTGYVPGLHFRYGKSYGRSATDSFEEFTDRISHQRMVKDNMTRKPIPKPYDPLPTVNSRDNVSEAMNHYVELNKYKEKHVSPEFPPIAGYTGHIPRVRSGEASLSQRYHSAAQRALLILRQEREARIDARGKGRG